MEAVSIDAKYIVSIVSTLFAIIGLLSMALLHFYYTSIKSQLSDIKSYTGEIKEDVEKVEKCSHHAHDRISEHVENFHAKAVK